ncbi:diphthamide synthesis protein [Candidatus Woesearchaeota archaeon]|nr:diphthamide synthesis protein [Candidatus Woesearchaeota archaeon]
MKTLFIEAKSDVKAELPKAVLQQIKQKTTSIGLFTTVQFFDNLDNLKKQLSDTGIEVRTYLGPHSKYEGQILGCTIMNFDCSAFLYVGDGKFHPEALVIKNPNKEVFCFDPFTKEFKTLDKTTIEKGIQRQKAGLALFYTKQKIGVIVSTKPGQFHLRKARELKQQFPNKKIFIFVGNTIDFDQLENFPFVEVWVNTACPRISYTDHMKFPKPVVDIDEIFKLERAR